MPEPEGSIGPSGVMVSVLVRLSIGFASLADRLIFRRIRQAVDRRVMPGRPMASTVCFTKELRAGGKRLNRWPGILGRAIARSPAMDRSAWLTWDQAHLTPNDGRGPTRRQCLDLLRLPIALPGARMAW